MIAASATVQIIDPYLQATGRGMSFAPTMYNEREDRSAMAQETTAATDVEVVRRRFTVDEFHRMGEAGILDEDDRLELLDGEIVEMTPIGSRHAACVKRLIKRLGQRVGDVAILDVQDPVILSERTELYPDIVLLKPRADFYSESHPQPTDVLLIVEVADTTGRYDRRVKVPRYARAGIPEVWIIDLRARAIDVYRRPAAEGYRDITRVEPGQSLPIPQIPDQWIAVNEVLS